MSGASRGRVVSASWADSGGRGAPTLGRRYIFGSNHNYRATHKRLEYYVIEDGRWKLLFSFRPYRASDGTRSRFSLYDLQNDPGEQRNVIAEQRAIARRLIGQLVRWRIGHRPYAHEGGPATFGAGESRSLQAMGYVGGAPPEEPESPGTGPTGEPQPAEPRP